MLLKKFILLIITIFFTSCSNTGVLVSDKGLAPSQKRVPKKRLFLIDLAQISGNTLYIDRKYFKESLSENLEYRGAKLEFNPDTHLKVNFTQSVLDKNRFKANYHYEPQYRIDRRVRVVVTYTLQGKSHYQNSFTYNVLLKSGSDVSYNDADRKAHKILFRKLGSMVAQRVLELRHKFK
ncbi:MAG: hypothetical protein ACWA5P_00010 [bacterium]